MSKTILDRADFDYIRYANCWEDADILLDGLKIKPGEHVLSIGSAGDNSFSLLTALPERVVAADINPAQLMLIELKKAAIKHLDYADFLRFLGFQTCMNREQLFDAIKSDLSLEARSFWSSNRRIIREGIIYQGKFEKYFQFFSDWVLPVIHSKDTITALFSEKNAEEQARFYNEQWNTWRWRALFRLFFSRLVLGRWGRDPEMMRHVKVSVAEHIFQKAETQLKNISAQSNFMLHFQLVGNFGNLLPHYAQAVHFEVVKQNIDRLCIVEGFVEQVGAQYGHFDAMNLSNIFEYMDEQHFARTAGDLLELTRPGARLAYWNLMAPRHISTIFPQHVQTTTTSLQDKGFFYNQFIVNQIQ